MSHPNHVMPSPEGDLLCRNILILDNQVQSLSGSIDRVEEKVDSIVIAINSLTRIEERQIAMASRLADGASTMQEHSTRLKLLEESNNKRTGAQAILVWLVGLVQVIGIGLWGTARNDSIKIDERIDKLELQSAKDHAK